MAHIKVVRRSMRPEEYIELRYIKLKRYIYDEMREISPVYIREARQTAEMQYEFYDEEYRELNIGELYYTPDGSAFIKCCVTIPEELKDREVYLYTKTSSEMTVKVNSKYAGGFDPNRQRILISPYTENGRCEIEILGYNRSKPDDERNPETLAVRGCRQTFEGLFLATVNEDVQKLCYDCELLWDIIDSEAFNEEYREFVIRELNCALNLIDFEDIKNEAVAKAIKYIDEKIYADKTFKGNGKVALISHSHLDLAYYWRRIHTVQKNLRTVLIQLRLMDKYPEFTYAHTQANTYETLEKYYPEVFAELKERIKEGRFEPVGAMYVEPDCNVPNAESLIRQCLYGQLYFRDKFGITVDSCWLPDVFGNSWILPQILRKSKVDFFVSNKMSTWNDTNRFPHNNFIWRGIDGTDIYACVPPTHFISWNEPSQVKENWEAFQDKHTSTETLQMFGYGDGGSGATEEMLELMSRFKKLSVMPETRHITAKEFLHSNFNSDHEFDVWDGELYLEMHRGTFTTKSNLKKYNRSLENKFRTAELLSVYRHKKGEDYPDRKLRELYKKMLVNQFHDILPGSHITPVYRDAIKDYIEIDNGLDEIIGTGDKLFNTLNFPRNGVEFIPDENGKITRSGKKGNFRKVEFAPLSVGKVEAAATDTSWFGFDNEKCSTPLYDISFAKDGSIVSLYDKKLCREWVKGDFNKLKMYDDRPGVYDAWDILPDYLDKELELPLEKELTLLSVDGECAELSVTHKTDKSVWQRIIRVFRQDSGIEVENIVGWNEKHKLMKVDFNCNILTRNVVCDTSAGFVSREMHRNTSWQAARFECCHHKWFDLSETNGGVSVINEGKYGIGITDKGVSLSLLRATMRPDPTSDEGEHNFCYKILPHAGSFIEAQINRKAHIYNAPLIKTDIEKITMPDFGDLYLQSVKKAEKSDMTVYRLSEQNGARGKLIFDKEVKILNMLEDIEATAKEIEYAPFEIITIGID
ncbi:MAG: alpha-mannosidase [Clostridia bacterium]|nr:alpha-mannosidase [Clostridia bacterium]